MRRQKNTQPFTIDINDLDDDGRGVGRIDDRVVFVAGALPGEQVEAQIYRSQRRFDEARTLQVLRASPHRVTPPCPHFSICAGCTLQHLAAPEQLRFKQANLQQQLERIGGVAPARWLPPMTADSLGYRRRARLSVRHVEKKGGVLVGFREHDGRFVAQIDRCAVLTPAFADELAPLAAVVGTLSQPGTIVQAELASGDNGAAIVLRHMATLSEADEAKLIAFSAARGLALYLQSGGPDTLRLLHPATHQLSYELPDFDLQFDFEPLDFVQVNGALNRQMVAAAINLLDVQPGQRVLDLFCGLGNFTLPMARRGARVTGVEGDAGLIERARHSAAKHALDVQFEVANLFDVEACAELARREFDAVLLDPPRAGAAEILTLLPHPSVQRVVYVSCHPGTLARDAKTLVVQHGFKLEAAGIMDMFSQTSHVESIALFVREPRHGN